MYVITLGVDSLMALEQGTIANAYKNESFVVGAGPAETSLGYRQLIPRCADGQDALTPA